MREPFENANFVPSGDQSGCSMLTACEAVTSVSPVPSALTTNRRSNPVSFRTKAIFVPSGDHVGLLSFWCCVTRVLVLPSGVAHQIPGVGPAVATNAIRVPSADQAGSAEGSPVDPAITTVLLVPSGSIV